MTRVARRREQGEEERTTYLELFFDLVFVFAVTQVSHLLLNDLSLTGALHAGMALLVVWWAWNYTTWVTNVLDPERVVVRVLLLGLTLLSLLLAVAIPEAFHGRAWLFAGAYVGIQLGRQGFLAFVASERGTVGRAANVRIVCWFVLAAPLWLAGAAAHGHVRVALWLAALAADYCAPLLLYRVPGLPLVPHTAWDVDPAHFAERFQLFVIIALGESIVLTGATTADLHLGTARTGAFLLAFVITACLWWLYFDYAGRIAQRRLELAPNRTIIARDAYTYLHAVLIAGIIVTAVGAELVIAHPGDRLGARELVAVSAGPALYLLAHTLFRLRLAGSLPPKRVAAGLACIGAGMLGDVVPAIAVSGLIAGVLVTLVVAERVAGIRRERRGEPSPLERLEQAAAAGRL